MSAIAEFLYRLIQALRPSDNPDPKIQEAWRQSMFMAVSGILIVGAGSLCWAQGWIPGVSGVALADDTVRSKDFTDFKNKVGERLSNLERNSDTIKLLIIKDQISKTLIARCRAHDKHSQEGLDQANGQLLGQNGSAGLLDQYRDLTGHPFDILPCDVLLITQQ